MSKLNEVPKESHNKSQWFGITTLFLIALIAYLFVTAPPPLPDSTISGTIISVNEMFKILNAENQAVRTKWTKTVSDGKKAGLKFNENWRQEGEDAGPLPALFLRETGNTLVQAPTLLRLFLGSDFPIVAANLLKGAQRKMLDEIRATKKPQFFYDESTKNYIAMFPDYAVSMGCVDCHNKHPNSSKTDWHLNDIMGATTWSFPKEFVSTEDVLKNISYLRSGFTTAYASYLKKVETFKQKPEIGAKWPDAGFFMPNLEVFAETYEKTNSNPSLVELTKLIYSEPTVNKKNDREAASF